MIKEMESEALILSFRQKLEVQRFAANTVKNYVDYARVFLKYMQRSSDKVILIRPSKGNKDRMVTLSERLLNLLLPVLCFQTLLIPKLLDASFCCPCTNVWSSKAVLFLLFCRQ